MFKVPKLRIGKVFDKRKFKKSKLFSDIYSKDYRFVEVRNDGRGYKINNPDGREFQLYYKDEEEFKDFVSALARNYNLNPNRSTVSVRIAKSPPEIYIDW